MKFEDGPYTVKEENSKINGVKHLFIILLHVDMFPSGIKVICSMLNE